MGGWEAVGLPKPTLPWQPEPGVLPSPWKDTSLVLEIVQQAPLLLSPQVQVPVDFLRKTYRGRCLAEV